MNLECLNNGGPRSILRLVNSPSRLESEVSATDETLAALTAWQARVGEIFSVVGPEGDWYRARLQLMTGSTAVFIPFHSYNHSLESPLSITVCQALPDKERFELILEKLTELGVSRLIPYQSEHSISITERDARQKKSHRWPDLLIRAARQCRRGMLPELFPVASWDQAVYLATRADLKLLLYEGAADWRLDDVLGSAGTASVSLLIGPEGGFSQQEVATARGLGILPVSVGPRLLRTETAAMTAVTILQHRLGDLR